MEKEGLKRVLQQEKEMNVEVLVTDGHRQINKWLREEHEEITNHYNVWHIVKGIALCPNTDE